MTENEALIEAQRVDMERPIGITARLSRAQLHGTIDLPLWFLIEETTKAISFNNYKAYMDYVLCGVPVPDDLDPPGEADRIEGKKKDKLYQLVGRGLRSLPFTDADAYRLLKTATEAFLTVNCGVVLYDDETHRVPDLEDSIWQRILDDRVEATDSGVRERWYSEYLKEIQGTDDKTVPYLALVRDKLPEWGVRDAYELKKGRQMLDAGLPNTCRALLRAKLLYPCLLELIWSYWHEQGMLVQTMNAISRRFQNIRGPAEQDPLAMLELDPLRPLNNLLWGYLQDEQHRLSLVRRAYEYDHHYGLTLDGKAVPPMHPADSRSKFLEAFHNLLYLCSDFFKRDDDTTVNADAFPVLVALRDVHLLLTEGAHNQFGDLPATARIEMLGSRPGTRGA